MTWADSYVSIDTETTGFGPKARVIEVAAVTFEKGRVVREWSTLLNPEGVDWDHPKTKEALAINHIERAQLEDKPRFIEIFPTLLVELALDIWVAHNLKFDLEMFGNERNRIEDPLLPPLTPKIGLCTMTMANKIHPLEPKHKLHMVAERWGIQQEGEAHRASSDAITCGRILHAMFSQNALPPENIAVAEFCKQANVEWSARGRRP